MGENPTLTVLMPCYNAERYLRPAIESVLNQSFRDYEFLIVEDGSSDKTREIISGYARKDKRIVPVLSGKNIGMTASLNKGIDMARGEFIARMDADDISHPERFEKQLSYLRKNPDVCLVATSRARIDEDGNILSETSLNPDGEELKRMMRSACAIVHGSVMFRRQEVIQLGKYREGIPYAEDYDLWLRMIEKHNIALLPDILYQFRLTTSSRSVSDVSEDRYYHSLVQKFARERKLYGHDSYHEHAGKVPASGTSEGRRKEMYHLYRGLEYLQANALRQAYREFQRCVAVNPLKPHYWALLGISVMPLPVIEFMRLVWRRLQKEIH